MAQSTFGERFGFARLLFHLEHGYAPGNAQIGGVVGREGQAVTAWVHRDDPPPDYHRGKAVHSPLSAFLGVERDWLIDNVGEPPWPDLWKEWLSNRRSRVRYADVTPARAAGAGPKRRRRRTG